MGCVKLNELFEVPNNSEEASNYLQAFFPERRNF
jgi:hypothetical protein